MQIYLVGGAVRDELLNRDVHERDWVVVGATEAEMLAQGFIPVGKSFPVFLHPDSKEEYALARKEKKTGPGYTGFSCQFDPSISLEQDLLRRDLTINAIAKEPGTGRYVDPYNGIDDLEKRCLRHVSPAFVEDPLRVLRVARFAARYHHLGFTIAAETKSLMQDIAQSGELESLVAERVFKEIQRALTEQDPQVFFEVLHDTAALGVILPELDKLWGIPNPKKHHPEVDSGIHTMLVLKQAALLSADPTVRFAALLHDVGKGETSVKNWPHHHGHEAHSARLVTAICKRLKIPKKFQKLAVAVAKHHGQVHGALQMKPTTVVRLLENVSAYQHSDFFAKLLLACQADCRGRPGFESDSYPQAEFLQHALNLTSNIDVSAWVREGLGGMQIKQRLHQERVTRLKAAKLSKSDQGEDNDNEKART